MMGGSVFSALRLASIAYCVEDVVSKELLALSLWGLQCPRTCDQERCNDNMVVSNGIRAKLEIFRIDYKGWGVRAAEFLPVGTFVCSYEGEVITFAEAVSHVGIDKLGALIWAAC
jgi:hypothetical protein